MVDVALCFAIVMAESNPWPLTCLIPQTLRVTDKWKPSSSAPRPVPHSAVCQVSQRIQESNKVKQVPGPCLCALLLARLDSARVFSVLSISLSLLVFCRIQWLEGSPLSVKQRNDTVMLGNATQGTVPANPPLHHSQPLGVSLLTEPPPPRGNGKSVLSQQLLMG